MTPPFLASTVIWNSVPFGVLQTRTVVDLMRRHDFTEWWHWWLLALTCLGIVLYTAWMYRRDSAELPRGVRLVLLLLRVTAFGGLLLFFLDLEKRTERQVTRSSRVAVLVDTSQSMGLVDNSNATGTSRLGQVIEEFSQGNLLRDLQQKHDVLVYRFDQVAAPQSVATFPKNATSAETDATESSTASIANSHILLLVAAGCAAGAVLFFFLHQFASAAWRGLEGESYALLGGTVALMLALICVAVASLRHPELTLIDIWRNHRPVVAAERPDTSNRAQDDEPAAIPPPPSPGDIEWQQLLVARGVETRVGEAIRWILDKERDAPLAGILLLTDGQHNAGIAPDSLVKAAQAAEVPIYPIGLGSEKLPRNIRLVDLEAPARVFPGDHFQLLAYVQADGLAGRTAKIKLEQRTLDDKPLSPPVLLERRVTLGADGQIEPISFEWVPEGLGRFQWVAEVETTASDDLDSRDNRRTSQVEVIERRSHVMLLAGGPNRDYRFLRNMLYRDPTTQVDVLLQSAPAGAAQEANEVLLEFPSDRDTLFSYDAIVAFDPDWDVLTNDQVKLLDEWVADKAGGLVVVAGPVHTPNWTRVQSSNSSDSKWNTLRNLYPVVFYRSGAATIQLGRVASNEAWPLKFTDEGKRAQFLWLTDSPTESENNWQEFPGVYGYQALRDVKPGAQVYARFADPQAATGNELPVYFAGHFYGAGRVFYMGSGEMWRLNELDPNFFSTFYTKLIRHVAQGRLLRDSSRGILLIDNERASLGDTLTVRAALSDEQYQPLALDQVTASLLVPSGSRVPVPLKRLITAERPGMYSGQFTATEVGDYRLELAIPGVDNELLQRELKVRLPAREIESPQRNDVLLSQLAKQTGGAYFVGFRAASGATTGSSLATQLRAKDQTTFLPGTADPDFEETLMTWLLAIVSTALCGEWLIRRLHKLA